MDNNYIQAIAQAVATPLIQYLYLLQSRPQRLWKDPSCPKSRKRKAPEKLGGSKNASAKEVLILVREIEVLERKKRRHMEIFVGGLDPYAKEDDIREVFEEFGVLEEVMLMVSDTKMRNRGFAFLRYATAADAKNALAKCSNVKVCGKHCDVAPVRDNDNPKSKVMKLTPGPHSFSSRDVLSFPNPPPQPTLASTSDLITGRRSYPRHFQNELSTKITHTQELSSGMESVIGMLVQNAVSSEHWRKMKNKADELLKAKETLKELKPTELYENDVFDVDQDVMKLENMIEHGYRTVMVHHELEKKKKMLEANVEAKTKIFEEYKYLKMRISVQGITMKAAQGMKQELQSLERDVEETEAAGWEEKIPVLERLAMESKQAIRSEDIERSSNVELEELDSLRQRSGEIDAELEEKRNRIAVLQSRINGGYAELDLVRKETHEFASRCAAEAKKLEEEVDMEAQNMSVVEKEAAEFLKVHPSHPNGL